MLEKTRNFQKQVAQSMKSIIFEPLPLPQLTPVTVTLSAMTLMEVEKNQDCFTFMCESTQSVSARRKRCVTVV